MSLSKPSIMRMSAQVWPKWLPKAVKSRVGSSRYLRSPKPVFVLQCLQSSLSHSAGEFSPRWPFVQSNLGFGSQQQLRMLSSSSRRGSEEQPSTTYQQPSWTPPADISKRPVVIIGAGVLGRRLAMMWASTGHPVNLYDTSLSALESATVYVADNLTAYCAENETHPGHVHPTTDLVDATSNAWMVIEAVPEDQELKISVLGRLDRTVPKDCIIATNSSSFTSRELSYEVKNRERLLNTLYYIPPGNRCVELMSCGYTSPSIFTFLREEMKNIGLQPMIIGSESLGMILPRLWAAMKRETLCMLQEGVAKPEDVDELFRDFFGARQGPCEKMDEIGLDNIAKVERHYLADARVRGVGVEHLKWLEEEYVGKDRLGNKTGEGLITKKKAAPGFTGFTFSSQEVGKSGSDRN